MQQFYLKSDNKILVFDALNTIFILNSEGVLENSFVFFF